MEKYLLLSFLLILSCNSVPTETKFYDIDTEADNYSRQFISYIIDAQLDSAIAMVNSEESNELSSFILNSSRKVNKANVKNSKIVEYDSGVGGRGKSFRYFRIGYEYEFEKEYILFSVLVRKLDTKMEIHGFHYELLQKPVSETTKFSFSNKTALHYLFFNLYIIFSVFIFITVIVVITTDLGIEKKILWTFIVLIIALPQFNINWNSGLVGYNLMDFGLFNTGFQRNNSYSPWLLSFDFPVGALIFWFKRKSLLTEEIRSDTKPQ